MSDEQHQDGPERQQSKPLHWRLGERPMQFGYIFIWIFVFVVAGVLSSGAGLTFIFKHPPAERQGGGQPIPSRGTAPTLAREAGLQMPAKVVGEQDEISAKWPVHVQVPDGGEPRVGGAGRRPWRTCGNPRRL